MLTDGLISEFKKDVLDIKKFLPPGWDQVGRALHVPPAKIEGEVGTDFEGQLDGVGEGKSYKKGGKRLAKSGSEPVPASESQEKA